LLVHDLWLSCLNEKETVRSPLCSLALPQGLLPSLRYGRDPYEGDQQRIRSQLLRSMAFLFFSARSCKPGSPENKKAPLRGASYSLAGRSCEISNPLAEDFESLEGFCGN